MASEVTGDLDKILERMANGLTRSQRIDVNKKGMEVYRQKFEENYNQSMNGHGKSIIKTLTEDTTESGEVQLGFSKKGKKAYLARFHNDGWVPRNQYGGPYKYHGAMPMVPGRHFWEHTNNDQALQRQIATAEVKTAAKYMTRKAHGGA